MPGKDQIGVGRTIITNSGSVSATNVTQNLKSYPALHQSIPSCDSLDIILDVTANTNTAGTAGQYVELQTSPNGGTTWFTFWRSAQITTSTTTQRCTMRTNGLGQSEAALQTIGINTVTGQIVQNCVVTEDQRVKWTIAAGTSALTFGLYAVVQPTGRFG